MNSAVVAYFRLRTHMLDSHQHGVSRATFPISQHLNGVPGVTGWV